MDFYAWIPLRLSYRIAFAASLLAAVFIMAIGGASYYVMRQQIAENIDAVIRNNAGLRAEHVSNLLKSVVSTLSTLSRNALIENAMVDSAGRDIYLRPFLRDLNRVNGVPVEVTVTDFEGKPLTEREESPGGFDHSTFAARVVDVERSLAQIKQGPNRAILIMGEPVIYGLTGRAEGAMILQLELESLLSSNQGSAESGGGARLLYRHFASDGTSPAPQPKEESDGADARIKVIQSVRVSDALASLGLAVEMSTDRQLMTQPLHRLTAIFLLVGLVSVLVVLILGIGAGRHLAEPLRELERVARSVIASGSFNHRLGAGGVYEVARFGELFNRMLERLSQAYEASKQQAAPRCARARNAIGPSLTLPRPAYWSWISRDCARPWPGCVKKG